MPIDTDAEILGLRAVLRDLVALSAIPTAWAGREPDAVAAGLADALIGLLQLDFVAVRLRDPSVAGAVDVTWGDAWKTFPDWLEGHLSKSGELPGRQIIPDVGGGVGRPCRGVVIPIGVNAKGGVVAAASARLDFPTDIDQLLLSLAANHAATAFQSACLIHERRKAEEELRKARDLLEVKVAARTAELRRSEAYLAEAQRLTHTGSLAIDVSTREVTHSSDEHSRLYGFDPEQGTPALSEFLHRISLEDRARCTEALERGIREATTFELEYRVVLPHGQVRRHRAVAHPIFDASGELDEFVATIVDVTERRQAETELNRLAGEQAALRRVATLVAQGVRPAEIFSAVSDEIGGLFGTGAAAVVTFEPDGPAIVFVGVSKSIERELPIGTRWNFDDALASAGVYRTGRPARVNVTDWSQVAGPIATTGRRLGVVSTVASPIIVEGRLWGAMSISSTAEPLPLDTEERLAKFTELVATAIANAESSSELAASRRRIVAAADEARRRIERDLHDGTQQRLISLGLAVRAAEAQVQPGSSELRVKLSDLATGLADAIAELHELSRGIHPAILTQGGLGPALRTLARRSPIPVELDVATDARLPEPIEVAAYYVASEALANAAKHAHASRVEVSLAPRNGSLLLSIRDDGSGGADPALGSGLVGLTDRVDALGGTIDMASPVGHGTTLRVTLPIRES
jgi:signal transduction histidine kinase